MKEIKNILIVTGVYPPSIGGPASYSRFLAEKLSKNFSVKLITYSSVLNFPDDKNMPFKVVRVWKKAPKGLRHWNFFLKALSAAGKSDMVFALNAVSAGIPALMAAKMRKKKFFVKIVGDYAWEIAINRKKTNLLLNDFQGSKKNGFIGLLHKLQTWVCKNADGVIVPSEYLAELVRGWGVSGDKIKVIYNGVDFKSANVTKEEAKKRIGVFGDIILSAGRLVPWKGFRMLIKIMPQLTEVSQIFRLVIVGDGPDMANLKMMVKNMGFERKVFLVGRKSRDELALYMAAADVFVLDTGYEGFSHQILEAMAAGIPVITTAVGGKKEIIKQGENGFMVKYNDEFNLIEAIKSVWASPELQNEFIEGGKKTAAYFSPEKMFDQTIKLLTNG